MTFRNEVGTGYSLAYDDKGVYVYGAGVANPTIRSVQGTSGHVIPEGGLFYRTDEGKLYRNSSGSWVEIFGGSADLTVGDDLTVGGNITAGDIVTTQLEIFDTIPGPDGTIRFGWIDTEFTFGGDGTQSDVGFLPANAHILFAQTEVGTTIEGDSVAAFDIGDGSDADRFSPTQRTTLTGGTKVTEAIPSTLQLQAAAGDLTVACFEVDGTTPADPTSGTLTVRLFVLRAV